MIRKNLVLLLVVLAFLLPNCLCYGATFDATAVVLAPITITTNSNLVFGGFLPGTGGTVTITAANPTVRGFTGAVTLVNSGSAPAPQAAAFTLGGTDGYNYTITLADGNITGPGAPMGIVFSFSNDGSGNVNRAARNLITGSPLYVGGELTVASGQTAGSYTGNFTITVAYD